VLLCMRRRVRARSADADQKVAAPHYSSRAYVYAATQARRSSTSIHRSARTGTRPAVLFVGRLLMAQSDPASVRWDEHIQQCMLEFERACRAVPCRAVPCVRWPCRGLLQGHTRAPYPCHVLALSTSLMDRYLISLFLAASLHRQQRMAGPGDGYSPPFGRS
jgi:hypothetical protein